MENLTWHAQTVTKEDRQKQNGHKSCILWLTGLSGSGKSTVANAVEQQLFQNGIKTYLLDGDNIRHGLNRDLDFSPAGRQENIRRIGETAKLFVEAGIVVITAFISPYRADRRMVREMVSPGEFIETYVRCPLAICEERDPKGLYQKARAGQIQEFTGISAPYEEPEAAEITVDTGRQPVPDTVRQILAYLNQHAIINLQKGE